MKNTKQPPPPEVHVPLLLDAHHRFIIACLVAGAAFLLSERLVLAMRLIVSWDAFALTVVILSWIVLVTKDPYEVRRNARIQDASATLLFTVVISAATASLLAVGIVLESAKSLPPASLAGHVGASVAAIVFSWSLVHNLFALRYAHLYYFNALEKKREDASGGLDFPGDAHPTYLDFAYFSYVIGMTCQVSDVQITAPAIRRLAMVHGLISFCFNTAILAIFVNIVAGLL
jgi:uncharacterized membrane protein